MKLPELKAKISLFVIDQIATFLPIPLAFLGDFLLKKTNYHLEFSLFYSIILITWSAYLAYVFYKIVKRNNKYLHRLRDKDLFFPFCFFYLTPPVYFLLLIIFKTQLLCFLTIISLLYTLAFLMRMNYLSIKSK